MHQYTDQMKYIYKVPSNGIRDHSFFEKRNKYYWERREPVNPDAPECYIIEQIEQGFQNDFHVMNSKNNLDRPVNEREYFDRPFSYMHQGFVFSPIHKRPVELS